MPGKIGGKKGPDQSDGGVRDGLYLRKIKIAPKDTKREGKRREPAASTNLKREGEAEGNHPSLNGRLHTNTAPEKRMENRFSPEHDNKKNGLKGSGFRGARPQTEGTKALTELGKPSWGKDQRVEKSPA